MGTNYGGEQHPEFKFKVGHKAFFGFLMAQLVRDPHAMQETWV